VITNTGPQGTWLPLCCASTVLQQSRSGREPAFRWLPPCLHGVCMQQKALRLQLFQALELQLCCKKGPEKLFNSPWEHTQPEMRWPKISEKPCCSCMFFTDCRKNLTERKTSVSRLETYPFGQKRVPLRNLAAWSGVFCLWSKTAAKVTLLYQWAPSEKLLNRLLSVQDRKMNPCTRR